MNPRVGSLLRIFVAESDRYERRALFDAIVEEARHSGIGGASVFKGIEGFGARGVLRSSRSVDGNLDLPVLIEIAAEEERIAALVERLRAMMTSGVLSVERVTLMVGG